MISIRGKLLKPPPAAGPVPKPSSDWKALLHLYLFPSISPSSRDQEGFVSLSFLSLYTPLYSILHSVSSEGAQHARRKESGSR